MKKEHKHYTRPKRPFDKESIEEEKILIKTYGLKNKREIWRVEHALNRIRSQAKKLITQPEQQQIFLARLVKLGLIKPNTTLDDVLVLIKEDLFERHLQTLVFKRGLATTVKKARQLIIHKKILIGDKIVSIPTYIVKKEEESKLSIKKEKPKKKEAPTEAPAEKPAEKPVEEKPVEEKKEEAKEEIKPAVEVKG